jgi:membrane associated rhomboid family serine protease
MSSGADLFVVCKQCGSEVSPYITECPYCGKRLRRRAPKLPRENVPSRSPRGLSRRLPRRRARSARPSLLRLGRSRSLQASWSSSPPYVTIALVAVSCATWVAWHAKPDLYVKMAIIGPLRGDWWKLVSSQFAYANGVYAFVTLVAVAIFGWLLERRHGPALVLALFLGAGAAGALVACAVYSDPVVSGANGAALALLAAWAAPDLRAARGGYYYEGDLLGTGAIAAVLLVAPFALKHPETSWLAGVTGGAIGLVVGLGLRSGEGLEP